VPEILTNHPSFFLSRLPTIAGFAQGKQQLLLSGQVGRGQFVALADPSVLINTMLRFEGNRQLAKNLLRHLAPTEDNRLLLLTGHFRCAGRLDPLSSDAEGSDSTQKFLSEYNAFLGLINDFAPTDRALRAAAFFCAGLCVTGLFLILPMPRRDLDGHWLRLSGEMPESFRGAHERVTSSASMLRDELEAILTEVLAAPDPVFTLKTDWLIRRVQQVGGRDAARTCTRLLVAMRKLPSDSATRIPSLVSGFRKKDLTEFFRLSQRLLVQLGSTWAQLPQEKDHARDH
jgi:hypothetical protein